MNNCNIYVTLFDSHYMLQGLTMYESLCNNINNFRLYIVAFDEKVYQKLIELDLKNTIIVSLSEFEDEELLSIKNTRTRQEYCWTCTPKTIEYVFKKYQEHICTYIDADLFFFSDPSCLIEELSEDESVLITAHRYSEYCDQTLKSGKYCVQFMTFKNDIKGNQVLKWWKHRCLEWCYARFEDGKFGDQKYVEQFGTLFEGVHELVHLGGGIAPWNVEQYTFSQRNNQLFLQRKRDLYMTSVIFYHFHAIKFFNKDVVQLTGSQYYIPDTAIALLYKLYIRKTDEICKKYRLFENKNEWINEQKFRDNDLDALVHEKNYYQYSLFI